MEILTIVNGVFTVILAIVTILQALSYKKIARNKGFHDELGRNLATKQDIAEITDKIESVKDVYTKSLEDYKFKLQHDYEAKKYSLDFCYEIDKEFINLLIKCLEGINKEDVDELTGSNEIYAYECFKNLNNFIYIYKFRYSEIPTFNNLIKKTNVTYDLMDELFDDSLKFNNDYIELKEDMNSLLDEALNILLPKYEIK